MMLLTFERGMFAVL